MAKLKTVDQKNKASGNVEIDDSITDTPYHKHVVSEVVRQFLASKQQGTHSTKNRSEVAYSTRKLYRQKGPAVPGQGVQNRLYVVMAEQFLVRNFVVTPSD
ncbi:MAG: hypothetical protein CM1200mP30_05770 [Pseudomonadota bacterium]|nr:MAG: hypothetical protein CM1200mP30_05770 [Pseudomonadota bacterium]